MSGSGEEDKAGDSIAKKQKTEGEEKVVVKVENAEEDDDEKAVMKEENAGEEQGENGEEDVKA